MDRSALLYSGHWESCANCMHWREKENGAGVCSRYDVTPPAKIIVLGCEEWEHDIPF